MWGEKQLFSQTIVGKNYDKFVNTNQLQNDTFDGMKTSVEIVTSFYPKTHTLVMFSRYVRSEI